MRDQRDHGHAQLSILGTVLWTFAMTVFVGTTFLSEFGTRFSDKPHEPNLFGVFGDTASSITMAIGAFTLFSYIRRRCHDAR
jgi:preprotein translocase subunit SecF